MSFVIQRVISGFSETVAVIGPTGRQGPGPALNLTFTVASNAEMVAAGSYLWGQVGVGSPSERLFDLSRLVQRDASGNIAVSGAGTVGIAFSSNTAVAAKAGLLQMDTGGNVILRNTTSGGQFFDSYTGLVTIRSVSAGFATLATISGAGIAPGTDNAMPIGSAGQRWTTVYAATGTINTSDEREKTWLGGIDAAERRAGLRICRELGFYQWNDAIEAKGATKARRHFGVRAQRVWAIMAEEGLIDPIGDDGLPGKTPYAFLCFDAWDEQVVPQLDVEGCETENMRVALEAGNRFGVRIDQLALFLIAAILPT